jgi:hypothetical protein
MTAFQTDHNILRQDRHVFHAQHLNTSGQILLPNTPPSRPTAQSK